MCASSTRPRPEWFRLTPLSRYPTCRETPSDAALSGRAEVTAARAPRWVEGKGQDRCAHRDADATAPNRLDQPGSGVDRADVEEVGSFERLDADDRAVVLDSEVEAPRRRRPRTQGAPVTLVHEPTPMFGQVLAGNRLDRGVVLVVGRLERRKEREVVLSHWTKVDVIAVEPKPEQGPVCDWDVAERVGHRRSVTRDLRPALVRSGERVGRDEQPGDDARPAQEQPRVVPTGRGAWS